MSGTLPGSDADPLVPSAIETYRSALSSYDAPSLAAILRRLGVSATAFPRNPRPPALAGEIDDRIAEPKAAESMIAGLAHGSHVALGLLALSEASPWPLAGLIHALGCLGVDPAEALVGPMELGLIALKVDAEERLWVPFSDLFDGRDPGGSLAFAHPSVASASRATLPAGDPPAPAGPARLVREADGLEPILRLAALWQRIEEAPARRTQQGSLYKRDRDRFEDDPVLAGPITDAIEPLPDMVSLWLDLARTVGLVADESGTDRVVAAPPEYWSENGVHLPQMLASRWLALGSWHEQVGRWSEDGPFLPALPFIRAAALLWLAKLEPDAWTRLESLVERFAAHRPDWDRIDLSSSTPQPEPARGRGRKKKEEPSGSPLAAMLLGPAYQLGLVRSAEEAPGGERIVQLSPLGRYVLALGPAPGPRPEFEHFLFVQPNFEIIAYRQGLNPVLIGQLSRFLRWEKLGAALETRLTAESVYRGLEGGLTTDQMLQRLARHSPRPLPAALNEAIRTWSGRRDRVTYHAAATLIEFASAEAVEAALLEWPEPTPTRVSERLLLVEAESSIPFARFRLAGSRDYRRPPEICVEVESDGVTLSLDLSRSDLFVDAELSRFGDEIPASSSSSMSPTRRRFRVSRESLARGLADGISFAALTRWYPSRTGSEIPPASRLLMHAASPQSHPIQISRPILLTLPSPDLLDGLTQHPDTRQLLGDRIGPTSILVPEFAIESLKVVLKNLGIEWVNGP